VRAEEVDAIASVLGRKVTGVRTLAGGFSHETCLLELGEDRVVVRLGGADPRIEAAVMEAARQRVPVPEVLFVLPARVHASEADGAATAGQAVTAHHAARPAMILEYVAASPLSSVLAGPPVGEPGESGRAGAAGDEASMASLGAEVGRVFARIGSIVFDRPGFFADADLTVGDMPPWSQQLPEMVATSMNAVPPSRLDPPTRRAWTELCAAHAPALARIDSRARLVHADANPKNILVSQAPESGAWQVDAVLDWEFSFSGCPYADAANMTRFGGDYPPGFTEGFRAGFAAHLPDDRTDWAYLGRVMDMFALSDLVTRPEGHAVADRAAAEIRRWIADGVPDSAPGARNPAPVPGKPASVPGKPVPRTCRSASL
jgi:aminoglycoside phosphotransferase (APT) family kinase protein